MGAAPCLALVALAALGLAPSPALADAAAGHAQAVRWCASCHTVDRGGRVVDAAPSFVALAGDPARTSAHLEVSLTASHPPMPDFQLSRREIADIVAYLESLRPR